MAYHVYTTKGIVVSSHPVKEADKFYSILTEDLGLIRARARGVRLLQSKLRGALEPYCITSVSLIKGKESWRITGAVLVDKLNEETLTKAGLKTFARVFALIERLVVGEESNKELFGVLDEGLRYVIEGAVKEGISSLEVLIVLRLLYELGYVSKTNLEERYITEPYSEDLLKKTEENKKRLVEMINTGLQSSNLV